ncbi:cupin domain-containing protein [Bradyrhizobium uaiense]|uniref:cupin domain-containing protein n=1 Tax=Bradyrhizobium uaiense TaxID=2594946 RepID=UPI001F2BF25E|nr:cupin domain-containing protein [Bradyrhizobium uaiense]
MKVDGVAQAQASRGEALTITRRLAGPGFRSLPHHHGAAETGAFVLSGRARIYFGNGFAEFVDLETGDFMFVPPVLPHLEANMSATEELWWLACRTPDDIVVNLPDVDDASLDGYSRG